MLRVDDCTERRDGWQVSDETAVGLCRADDSVPGGEKGRRKAGVEMVKP